MEVVLEIGKGGRSLGNICLKVSFDLGLSFSRFLCGMKVVE